MSELKKNLPSLLVVDDDSEIRTQLRWALKKDFYLLEAGNQEEALEILRKEKVNIVALDISLDGSIRDHTGLELLKRMLEDDPTLKIIIITGNSKKEVVLNAIGNGAFDYYLKPIDISEFKVICQRAIYIQRLEEENRKLLIGLTKSKQFQEIIGDCPELRRVFETIRKVAPTDATILITGESGTGKELVARAIHNSSERSEYPFVTINCGAIPDNLLESELFGHEKGAFTGAYYKKVGKFENANGGTIFLDEVGELSLAMQVKLLRFLQEHTIERIGGTKPIHIDARIIAATNKNLLDEINNGRFREDLYYRFGVINIFLPPLRERGDDIPLLANYFLALYKQQYSKNIYGFSESLLKIMGSYDWPGNIRELENRIRRAVLLSNNCYLSPRDLDLDPKTTSYNYNKGLKHILDQVEEDTVRHALQFHFGNISKAAANLKISRAYLYDLIKKHKINSKEYRKK